MCDLRRGSTTSLIEVQYTTHSAEEAASNPRVPSGLPYASLKAGMQSLDVVFLSRFLFEVLGYINLLVALQPEPLEAAREGSQEETGSRQKQSNKQQEASFAPAYISV